MRPPIGRKNHFKLFIFFKTSAWALVGDLCANFDPFSTENSFDKEIASFPIRGLLEGICSKIFSNRLHRPGSYMPKILYIKQSERLL